MAEQDQPAPGGANPDRAPDNVIRRISGGATMDPRTGTVGGPSGPTGIAITNGGTADISDGGPDDGDTDDGVDRGAEPNAGAGEENGSARPS